MQKRVLVYLPPDALDMIDRAAEARSENRSEYVVKAALERAAGELGSGLTKRQRKAIARALSRFVIEEMEV